MKWQNATKQMLLAAAAAVSLTVGQASAADPGLTDTEITIGLFGPLSGPLVGYGLDPVNAAKMWYDDINKKGGIHGRKIKLVIEDDKCTANDLVAVVKKLVTVDNVFMLHGGSCTAALTAAQEYINREKVPYSMLNAAGDNAVIPPLRYTFGAFHGTQRVYAAALAGYAINELKVKRAAVIVHDDDYGKANLATTEAILKASNVEVVAAERIDPRITDVTAPLLKIRAARPDVILSGAYPAPAVLIAQKYGEYSMTSIPLMQAVQGIPTPSVFAKNVGNPAALQNFYHGWSFTDVGNEAIKKKYADMYKAHYPDREAGPFMITGLPSAMAVAAALDKAGRNLTRESFVAAMESLDFKPEIMAGPLQFGPNRRDGMRSGFVVKYNGTTQKMMPGVYTWNGKDGL
jgi:branched-chain amino acid transport system substrate-binding protein